MKYYSYTAVVLCAWIFIIVESAAKRIVIDEVLAIVPHMGGDRIILSSDMLMQYGNGDRKTFRDVVLEEGMLLRARDLGIALPDAAVDSMLVNIQKKSGMNRDQLTEMFESQGLTWQEGKDMLRNRRMIEEMLSILVRPSEPTKEEIRRYYDEHAPHLPAEYTIRLAYISATEMSNDEIRSVVASGETNIPIMWDDPKTYTENDLTEEQRFICAMSPGEIRIMDETGDGYDVLQLLSKKESSRVPFDEAHVVAVMSEAVYQELLVKFQEELLAGMRIRYCKPELEALLLTN